MKKYMIRCDIEGVSGVVSYEQAEPGRPEYAFGRRMFIDFGLALGVFYSGYDPYVWGNDATGWYYYDYAGDPDTFRKRNQRLLWWGPTRIYLNIGFDFSNRHRAGRTGKE